MIYALYNSFDMQTKYANSKGLGGIMFWAADIDDFKGECHNKPYPLIEAGKEALFDNSGYEQIIFTRYFNPKMEG